jgi:hypothetical protein
MRLASAPHPHHPVATRLAGPFLIYALPLAEASDHVIAAVRYQQLDLSPETPNLQANQVFAPHKLLVEPQPGSRRTASDAIALDEAFAENVAAGESKPLLRIWANERALVVPRWQLRDVPVRAVIDRYGRSWPVCGRGSGGTVVAERTRNTQRRRPTGRSCL